MKPQALNEIAFKLGLTFDSKKIVTGASVDSRLLQAGDLFFALPGTKVDGHSFLEAAAIAGAGAAVVRKDYNGPHFGLPLLFVDNVLDSLQRLSKLILQEGNAKTIAVTGSLGKTTTKEFLVSLLKNKFKVSASPGNGNSQIGLPLAILNHTSVNDEIIILEMGMTKPGQLSKLVEIAPPDIALITTVALVHAENFNSLEDIAKAKAEIFSHPSTRIGLYHTESDLGGLLKITGSCLKQSFSTTASKCDFSLQVIGNHMVVKEPGQMTPKKLPLLAIPGGHNRHNFIAAVSVARNLGLDWEEIEKFQSQLQLPERRLELVERQGVMFVNDAYNASEMSMKGALDSLPVPGKGKKKIAFFGGMVELGKFSDACHRAVAKYALERVDVMLCFGSDCLPMVEEWEKVGRQVIWAKEREELLPLLHQQLQSGDVVLLKGSQAKGVWKVLEELSNLRVQ